MTIKSLQDLNTYAQTPITYDDLRTAQVLFDRGATVDQTLTVSENTEFTLPWGINIDDITQYDIADVEYHIDLDAWSDPVSIRWEYLPDHIVVTRGAANSWIVSEIRSRQDWLYVREALVLPPFGFTGLVQHEASIKYYSDNQDSSRNSATWDIDVTFTQVEYFSSTVDRTYVSNTTYSNIDSTEIITDPEDFDPVWDLRVYASDTNAITEIFSNGSPGEAAWNDTTKQYVITGDTESVNLILDSMDVEIDRFSADFTLYFKLANNYTSDIEYQVQQFLSRDFISDLTAPFGQTVDNNYIRGFVADDFASISTFDDVTETPLIRDPNPTEITSSFDKTTLGGIIFQLDEQLDTVASITPNGGLLIEGGATLNSAFSITPNGGFLLEHEASTHDAAFSVSALPLLHGPNTMVLTIDQTKMPNWDATPGSNYVAHRMDFGNNGFFTRMTSDYSITAYGSGGAGSVETGQNSGYLNDNMADEPYVILAIEYTGTTPVDFYIDDGHEQLISIDRWGYFNDYAFDLDDCVNLEYFDQNGPDNTSSTQTSLWTGIKTSTHTYADSLFDQIADFGPSVFTDLTAYLASSDFDEDISSWDVSSVTDMSNMFFNNDDFDQDISSWDVSSVTDMGSMFESASSFNQDISSWDTSSVTNMNSMFKNAAAFDQDISGWDVDNVTDSTDFDGGTTNSNWTAAEKPDFS